MIHRANLTQVASIPHRFQLRILIQKLPSLILRIIPHLLLPRTALASPMARVRTKSGKRSLVTILPFTSLDTTMQASQPAKRTAMMRNGIAARFAAKPSRTTVEPTRSQSIPDLATTLMRMVSASTAAVKPRHIFIIPIPLPSQNPIVPPQRKQSLMLVQARRLSSFLMLRIKQTPLSSTRPSTSP